MKIKDLHGSGEIMEIPEELEERVMEFLKLTKVYLHSKRMHHDGMISASEQDSIWSKFLAEEGELDNLLAVPKDAPAFEEYYWELYED
jgi:hypothetical protein